MCVYWKFQLLFQKTLVISDIAILINVIFQTIKWQRKRKKKNLLLRNLTTTKPNTFKLGLLQSYHLPLSWITPTLGSFCIAGWRHFQMSHHKTYISVVYILLTSHSLLNSFQSGLVTLPKQLLLRPPRPEMTINPDLILLDFSAAIDSGDWLLFPRSPLFPLVSLTSVSWHSSLLSAASLHFYLIILSSLPGLQMLKLFKIWS